MSSDTRRLPSRGAAVERLAENLFGSSAPADEPGARWLGRYLALAGVLALIAVVRRPDAIRNAEFWAEDGSVFFVEQLTLGFWSALAKGFAGFPYLRSEEHKS